MPSLDALFRANSSHNSHNLAKPAKGTLDGADFSANHDDAFNTGKSSQPLIESRHLSRESMVLTGTFVSFFSGLPRQTLESRYSATYFRPTEPIQKGGTHVPPIWASPQPELLGPFAIFRNARVTRPFIAQSVQFRY